MSRLDPLPSAPDGAKTDQMRSPRTDLKTSTSEVGVASPVAKDRALVLKAAAKAMSTTSHRIRRSSRGRQTHAKDEAFQEVGAIDLNRTQI